MKEQISAYQESLRIFATARDEMQRIEIDLQRASTDFARAEEVLLEAKTKMLWAIHADSIVSGS